MFQLGAALLDVCVLAVLNRGDTYGYALTQSIKVVIAVSESTLYPVLRRLQKEGLLVTYDVAFNGRNRRYYQITAAGKSRFAGLSSEWGEFKQRVDQILFAAAAAAPTVSAAAAPAAVPTVSAVTAPAAPAADSAPAVAASPAAPTPTIPPPATPLSTKEGGAS
ncbi:MAG: PadR family transcriptional regulator [Coriobacteriales bacterium]|jgi:PadR family transcriptional regulator PadR|nr:PadR family transcriptional regulator [Coriobacteriales bacterium]